MIKKISAIFLICLTTLSSYAYEDCVIFSKSKLTDINIENNSVVDVSPLVTIGNEKNTLIVHPLNIGRTRFCVLKDNKNIALFDVQITENETQINAPDEFEVLPLDLPDEVLNFELDEPPEVS